jgi:hypothetical protein
MKKHTVTAGIIAGVVVACSGPGLDAMGGMMHDAGHAVAGAGGSLANAGRGMLAGSSGSAGQLIADASVDAGKVLQDAGQMLSDAGLTIANAGHSAIDSGKAQEAGDGLPRAHWILRDKDGTPVKADVYPAYSQTHPKFTESAPECVSVSYLGKRTIGMAYSLSTGHLSKYSECPSGLPDAATWRESPYGYFLDAACSGQAYGPGASYTIAIGGVYYYSDGTGITSKPATYYSWNKTMGMCQAVTNTGGLDLWMFKQVPADILNLLPSAPYSVELVY